MLSEWGLVGFLIVLALVFPLGGILSSWMLGVIGVRPDRPEKVKEDTYESGVVPEGTAWVQFNFRYYYYALLFVIFDVEAVFLYPWAVSLDEVGISGFIAVVAFIAILTIGLVYAWRKNALEWS